MPRSVGLIESTSSDISIAMIRVYALFFAALLLWPLQGASAAENWESTVDVGRAENFPAPRALQATYGFGWNGFTAATAEVNFAKADDGQFHLRAAGRTVGLARTLWKFDVAYETAAAADTLRPISLKQSESTRSKQIVTELAFDANGVTRKRIEKPAKGKPSKTRRFDLPNLFDLQSALLYLRSQPLEGGEVHRLVVYPTTSAYLATVTVAGRESISVPAGKFNAIKLNLQLSKISKDRKLEPHRKFRRASVWISDDADRMILRIEAQIFVGTVFAELQSVRFDNAKL